MNLSPLWCSAQVNVKRVNPTVRIEKGKIHVFALTFDTSLLPAVKLHKKKLLRRKRPHCQLRRTFSMTEEKGGGQNDVKTVLCHCRKNQASTLGDALLQKPSSPSQKYIKACQKSTWMDGLVEGCS